MSQTMADQATNPFDDEDGNYTVLANAAGEHSLWPAGIPVPGGWRVVHGTDRRAACLAYVNQAWPDLGTRV
ncbi:MULTISPECIES: MbtH family protein [unclassified Streptomyces]|uniref:MbtH family protein n=1 Tax=unclassified Streptomyces TaxID=2593676 RepID=UPI00093DF3C0|nr:MbtH family protein [Streptomyces sp. CB02058]